MSVILITGSSTGIGLATVLHFGRKGHEVYASLRNPEAAPELMQAITAEKLPVTPIKLVVNDEMSVQRGVAEVHRKAGHIDVLVNNAGLGGWSSGGSFALSGSIGQPFAGAMSGSGAGGDFTLGGGFWGGGTVSSAPSRVYLPITLKN